MPNELQAVETEEEVISMIILQLYSIETQIKWNLYETTPIKEWNLYETTPIKEWNYAGHNICGHRARDSKLPIIKHPLV